MLGLRRHVGALKAATGRRSPSRIHFRIARREHDIHARVAAQFQIAFQVARVFGEVLRRRELRRIDINADDDLAVFADPLARLAHQAHVAGVQIAHRRHKADANALALPLQGEFLHGGGLETIRMQMV